MRFACYTTKEVDDGCGDPQDGQPAKRVDPQADPGPVRPGRHRRTAAATAWSKFVPSGATSVEAGPTTHGPWPRWAGTRRIGTSNALFLPDGTPSTAEQRSEALDPAFGCRLKLMGRGLPSPAQLTRRKTVLLGRCLRVAPWRRTASIGPDNPRVQPIPACTAVNRNRQAALSAWPPADARGGAGPAIPGA